MAIAPLPKITPTAAANFPEGYFLENLAVRADGSVLVTTVLQKELWCVPRPTSTAQKVFMRVPVDPDTHAPAGLPELAAAITDGDDFCLDETGGLAYVTRHRANAFDRVSLTPGHGSEVRHLVGDPFDATLAGPSSACWGRGSGDYGRIAYVTTDGGRTAPPEDGIVRRAALLRAEFGPGAAGEER